LKGQEVEEEEKGFLLDFLSLEEGTDMLSGNVGKGLSLDVA
jgi:hypothetical protein